MKLSFISLLLFLQSIFALQIPVYKLIKYEHQGVLYGSQVSSLKLAGAHYKNVEEIQRKMALVHASDLHLTLFHVILANKPGALLIILEENEPEKIRDIELYLGTHRFYFPIFFTFQTLEIMELYEQLYWLKGDGIQFVLNSNVEAEGLRNVTLENYYGFLNDYDEALPTVVLAAHYDSFSIVPELSFGMDSNGSGVIALGEIAKLLKKNLINSKPKYNVLILFNSGGNDNFIGLQRWLDSKAPDLKHAINNIAFALCLDTIGKSEELTFHITRFPRKDETELINLFSGFNRTASKYQISLNYFKKKVDLVDNYIPWGHETFIKKKIVAATLSHLERPANSTLEKNSIYDRKSNINLHILEKNVMFIYEALVRFLDGDHENAQMKVQAKLSSDALGWLKKFSSHSRFPTKIVSGSEFLILFRDYVREALGNNMKLQKFHGSDDVYFDTKVEILNSYKMKSKVLDLYIFLYVVIYLLLLWISVKYVGSIKFITSKKSRHKNFNHQY
ncbi:unnamed protein product [Blepharisma stoltei]|uniref:BOS complex subunit NCLN n=1 Tax=Blepharisma stoltei TaxID=1481888 RepID=A0AAU9ILJ4_9CILI|nr:unnamed protein product [Blepharisma stoltei]